ncbi:MAG: hypothetical protein RL524_261, partial [Actinomycetota bacterium]
AQREVLAGEEGDPNSYTFTNGDHQGNDGKENYLR